MKIQGTEYKCPKCNWDTPTPGQVIFCESLLKGFYCPECSEMLEPVKEVKDIRPEKEGELWVHETGGMIFVHGEEKSIKGTHISGMIAPIDKLIHNKDGWTRERPKVEEDVERIVIEDVSWNCLDSIKPF